MSQRETGLCAAIPTLDELLRSGLCETVVLPNVDDDGARACGWYEAENDPWNVRWWSGREWTGEPVPLTPSMLVSTFRTRP